MDDVKRFVEAYPDLRRLFGNVAKPIVDDVQFLPSGRSTKAPELFDELTFTPKPTAKLLFEPEQGVPAALWAQEPQHNVPHAFTAAITSSEINAPSSYAEAIKTTQAAERKHT
ncbi:hypothetical protein LTR08_001159 [Meristemomyces frigidus]|nr:hypothetical protein LTR08_001159 [Meristemomyces frigidus]